MPRQITQNTLFYGDNLDILREYLLDESVDLIYLDPPFNSNRNYNVLFKDESGKESEAQITAFEDTWHWDQSAEGTYRFLITKTPNHISTMVAALRNFIGTNQMMAYLTMMTVRLFELHRVLKRTGSLYLHCDPTASHYLKIILDTIFDPRNFRNEIGWRRTSAHSDTKQGMRRYGKVHDVLFFYTKSEDYAFNPLYTPYTKEYLESEYRHKTPEGRYYKETDLTEAKAGGDTQYEWRVKRLRAPGARWEADLTNEYLTPRADYEYEGITPYSGRYWAYSKENLTQFAREGHLIHRNTGMPRLVQYADEMPGIPLQDLWDDITTATGQEALGYPTQKPLALLERIVNASSNPRDVVLDPFCGCGTAIAAAQKLERKWMGIDITLLSMTLQKQRLKTMFPGIKFDVVGEPNSLEGAKQLANDDRYKFQYWALGLIPGAFPYGAQPGSKEGKKGSDRGVDGILTFIDDHSGKPKRAVVQVKSGKVDSQLIRELVGTVEQEDSAVMGIFVMLKEPTSEMKLAAVKAGVYFSPGWGKDYPKIQILTIEELLHGAEVKMPPQTELKKSQRVNLPVAAQGGLFDSGQEEEEA